IHPEVLAVVHGNLEILWLTLVPLFVYAASRRYLQAIGLVRVVPLALAPPAAVHGNLEILWLTLVPLFVYAASRRYLQAIGLVRVVALALLAANVVNLVGNWARIYGRLGLPALGTDGAAWATCIARVTMAAITLGAVVWHDW